LALPTVSAASASDSRQGRSNPAYQAVAYQLAAFDIEVLFHEPDSYAMGLDTMAVDAISVF
jgi:hypothetical protein